jgi:hypothetical protein
MSHSTASSNFPNWSFLCICVKYRCRIEETEVIFNDGSRPSAVVQGYRGEYTSVSNILFATLI